jgi:hypothetical protein
MGPNANECLHRRQPQHVQVQGVNQHTMLGNRLAAPFPDRSLPRLPQHAGFHPSRETYASAAAPLNICYPPQNSNSWLPPTYSGLSHTLSPQERSLMVDRMQVPFRDDSSQLQQHREDNNLYDLRRELHDLQMLEAMLAARHRMYARLGLACRSDRNPRLADQRNRNNWGPAFVGQSPLFLPAPRQPPPRRRQHEELGLDLLGTAAIVNSSRVTSVPDRNLVIPTPPPPIVKPSPLAPRLSSEGSGTTTTASMQCDSMKSRCESPSTVSPPSSQADDATRDASPPTSSFHQGRTYVDSLQDLDILCGRGGKTNHHTGNKKFRHVVTDMKMRYQHCPAKSHKTDLSRQIVDYCASYGARFLKRDNENGKYYTLSKEEARRKTSQALREPKMLKWTTT